MSSLNSKGTVTVELLLVLPLFIFFVAIFADLMIYSVIKTSARYAVLEAGRFCKIGKSFEKLSREDSIYLVAQESFYWAKGTKALDLATASASSLSGLSQNPSKSAGKPGDYVKISLEPHYIFITPLLGKYIFKITPSLQTETIIQNEISFSNR